MSLKTSIFLYTTTTAGTAGRVELSSTDFNLTAKANGVNEVGIYYVGTRISDRRMTEECQIAKKADDPSHYGVMSIAKRTIVIALGQDQLQIVQNLQCTPHGTIRIYGRTGRRFVRSAKNSPVGNSLKIDYVQDTYVRAPGIFVHNGIRLAAAEAAIPALLDLVRSQPLDGDRDTQQFFCGFSLCYKSGGLRTTNSIDKIPSSATVGKQH